MMPKAPRTAPSPAAAVTAMSATNAVRTRPNTPGSPSSCPTTKATAVAQTATVSIKGMRTDGSQCQNAHARPTATSTRHQANQVRRQKVWRPSRGQGPRSPRDRIASLTRPRPASACHHHSPSGRSRLAASGCARPCSAASPAGDERADYRLTARLLIRFVRIPGAHGAPDCSAPRCADLRSPGSAGRGDAHVAPGWAVRCQTCHQRHHRRKVRNAGQAVNTVVAASTAERIRSGPPAPRSDAGSPALTRRVRSSSSSSVILARICWMSSRPPTVSVSEALRVTMGGR